MSGEVEHMGVERSERYLALHVSVAHITPAKDFADIYTPTSQERLVTHRSTKGRVAEVGFLVLLKTYQRLGRFVPLSEVPSSIIEHIAKPFAPQLHISDLDTYDRPLSMNGPDYHAKHLAW